MLRLSQVLGVFYILSCLLVSCKPTPPKKDNSTLEVIIEPQKLDVNEFEKKLAASPNAQLVDVRTPAEYKEGYLKGAININYQGDTFADDVAKLDKTKPTFVYCRSGGRSSEASKYMSKQGFTEVYDMQDGITAWAHYNKPIEK